MRVVIGADHAGFGLKEIVVAHLIAGRTTVNDVGTDSTDPVEYPPICAAVAELVVVGEADWGIVIGGSGQGEQIAANKVVGARAALCGDLETARLARAHNDANVLALGGRVVAGPRACQIVDVFGATAFDGGRHQCRIDQIAAMEVTKQGP